MSGESFFSIDHTPQQQPTHKGNVTQESKPQGDENRSGIMSYEDLMAERRAKRVAAGLADALRAYNGTTKDEDKGKTVSPEAIYRGNILYAARVTDLVLNMREQELAMYGSNDARQLEETKGTNGVVKALETRAFVGGETDIDPTLWDKQVEPDDEYPSSHEAQVYSINGNNSLDRSLHTARQADTANNGNGYYYSGRRAA
ncbi:MAG: hypothetical protein Q4B27_03785 [Candidatus Saccharibacteria bacterium]|nr:hypothetical protein [Candidatus Saccharibacteria bacterium]